MTSSEIPVMPRSNSDNEPLRPSTTPSSKGLKFSLIMTSMCVCLSLSALELSAVSTALPTIAYDLNATDFTWVGSAYALASTSFLPMSGGLAQTFGRRPAILLTLGLFALGSGVCGGAKTMNMLIAGRTIQGLGGGGIQSLTAIVLGDLVTLRERGVYAGLYGLVWSLAASVGPVVGGSLAAKGQWRWLFYLNLPITFVACVLVIVLLDLPIPPGSMRDKFFRMDWIGNFLVISSTVACTIGLTWGGINAPWDSAKILVPLILGLVGLGVFIAYEGKVPANPLVPFSLMTNLTSASGYMQAFCAMAVTLAAVYYFPVYFQACKLASAEKSGIYSLGVATLAPAVIITGVSIKLTRRYRLQSWIGWVFMIVAFGLMSTIRATDPLGKSIGYIAILGCGVGALSTTPNYPILAPLPVTQNAPALAFMWFLRSFASVWGITIGSTVLQNELAKKLPESFLQSVPQGTAIAYALIPQLSQLPAETLYEVQVAFASSLAVLWRILACISGGGFLVSFFMKGIPLPDIVDDQWTLNEKRQSTWSAHVPVSEPSA